MDALVLEEATVDALVADRQRLGIDRYDEVHAGRYVINPAPNKQHSYLVTQTILAFQSILHDEEMVGDTVNV